MGLLYALLIGALAGWLAGKIMKGGGFGTLLNIILGIVGGVVGNWLFGVVGVHIGSGIVGDLITGVIGAVVILLSFSYIKKLVRKVAPLGNQLSTPPSAGCFCMQNILCSKNFLISIRFQSLPMLQITHRV